MTKLPRADSARDGTATLVRAFLASATSAFAPRVAEAAARWSFVVEQSTGDGFVPVTPEQITHTFVATATFSNARVAGEVTFGDREYSLNTVLGPAGSPNRFGLWEWANALERPEIVPRNTDFVLTVNRLEAIVEEMARAVAALEGEIAQASASVIVRIEHARADVQAAFQSRVRADDHRRASAAAAEAFRRRDYRRVVALLEPYLAVLTAAEHKKLIYAKRRL